MEKAITIVGHEETWPKEPVTSDEYWWVVTFGNKPRCTSSIFHVNCPKGRFYRDNIQAGMARYHTDHPIDEPDVLCCEQCLKPVPELTMTMVRLLDLEF